jgi:Ca2+-transporting ATPase
MGTVTSAPVSTLSGRPEPTRAPSGLSSTEAQRRLIESGPNEIRREESQSALALFARQFASPVIWLLVGASVLSAALGELLDAGAIGAIVRAADGGAPCARPAIARR